MGFVQQIIEITTSTSIIDVTEFTIESTDSIDVYYNRQFLTIDSDYTVGTNVINTNFIIEGNLQAPSYVVVRKYII